MNKREKLVKFIKLSWKGYVCLCVISSTVIGVVMMIGVVSYLNRHIKFPNGVMLAYYFNNPGGFKLKNEHGKTILKVHHGQAISQGDFVLGMAYDIDDNKGVTKDFIYKVGWEKPIVFNESSEPSFSRMSTKLGLRWSLDYPPDLFEREDYKECIQHDGKSDCRYKMLDKFWADIESGKEPLYVCNHKKSIKPCGGYSLFKTYLSLRTMPRYRQE